MPWKTLNNWFFDGDRKSPIPEILISKNFKISNSYLMSMFVKNGALNHYLNEYMNNIWIHSIKKDELLLFLKKCIFDYRINKTQLYYKKRLTKDKLFDVLREKIHTLKNDDIDLLCNIINKSDKRHEIYCYLDIEIPKVKKNKKKPINKKVSLNKFIKDNFIWASNIVLNILFIAS